jgi:hypothetical protein
MTEQVPVTKESLEFSIAQTGAYPLKKFRGKCIDYNPVTRAGQSGPYTVVEFDFSDVQVLPGGSSVPYTMDTGKIGISWQPPDRLRDTHPWHHLSKSVTEILGETGRVNDVVGKVIEVDWQERRAIRKIDEEFKETTAHQYVFVEIDGKRGANEPDGSAPSAASAPAITDDELFTSIADGKSAPDFNAAALQDDRVKNGTGWGTIINGGDALLAQLVLKDMLAIDSSQIYHAVLKA